jgi:hypothetical protein
MQWPGYLTHHVGIAVEAHHLDELQRRAASWIDLGKYNYFVESSSALEQESTRTDFKDGKT